MYWLFEKTIMSILTALIILTIKKILKKKANPLWHYYIWIILFVQLLIPRLPYSNFSISRIVPLNKVNMILNNQTTLEKDANNFVLSIQDKAFFSLKWQNIIIAIWIIGAVFSLIYFITNYINFKRSVTKLPEIDNDEVLFTFESVKNKLKINCDVPIYEYNGIPMIVGFFKPILLIPKDYDHLDLEVLFYHELTHYKYFDTLINWIAILLRCLFWFNPLIWYSFKTMQNDCELACDYHVIKKMDVKDRKIYASTLLKYTTMHMASTEKSSVIGVHSMADCESEIKNRIYQITKFKRYSVLNTIFIVVVSIFVSITCLTKINTEPVFAQVNSNTNNQINSTLGNTTSNNPVTINSSQDNSAQINSDTSNTKSTYSEQSNTSSIESSSSGISSNSSVSTDSSQTNTNSTETEPVYTEQSSASETKSMSPEIPTNSSVTTNSTETNSNSTNIENVTNTQSEPINNSTQNNKQHKCKQGDGCNWKGKN